MLDLIQDHSGVLISRGRDELGHRRWRFLHRVFAEYLTARAIVAELSTPSRAALRALPPAPQWRGLLVLAAGELARGDGAAAGAFVADVAALRSTPWEHRLSRDLLLALTAFGETGGAIPSGMASDLLGTAVARRRAADITHMRWDLDTRLRELANAGYAPMLAACLDETADTEEVLAVARLAGGRRVAARLESLLAGEPGTAARAALKLHASERAVELLAERAADLPTDDVAFAAGIVAQRDLARGVGMLEQEARSPDAERVFECVRKLADDMPAEHARDALCRLLDVQDARLRGIVARAFAELDDADVGPALRRLVIDDPRRRWLAVRALEERGEDPVPSLVELLDGDDALAAAAYVFATSGNEAARPVLEERLGAPEWSERVTAAAALSTFDLTLELAVLLEATERAPERARLRGRAGSVRRRVRGRRARHADGRGARTNDATLREEAIETLAASDHNEAVELLVKLLEDEDEDVTLAAAWALVRLGVADGVPPVVAAIVAHEDEPTLALADTLDDLRPPGLARRAAHSAPRGWSRASDDWRAGCCRSPARRPGRRRSR